MGARDLMAVATTDIVTMRDGEPVTTTLAISAGTATTHEAVIKLVRTYLADFEEFGLVRFQIGARSAGQHGGGDTEFAELNEEQSALLLAYMRNSEIVRQFKKDLIRGFFNMRSKLRALAPPALPDFANPAVAARAWAEQFEAKLALTAQIVADAPKVAFAEAIRSIDGVCHIEKVAKTIGIGRNKFFNRLREDGILMRSNLPYQKYIDREYFTVNEQEPYTDKEGVKHPTFTAMVTGAGQVFLVRKYSPGAAA